MMRCPLIALAAVLVATPALANDTEAQIALGGLIFEMNDQISMDAEDLFLSLDKVRVRYTYTNHSSAPITLLVAFPLPAVPLPGADPEWTELAYPDWGQIDMETRVDGKVVGLMRIDIAKVAGADVDKRLKELGWPARHWEDPDFLARINALPDAEKFALTGEGLLAMDEDEPGRVRPFWSVETSFVRTQTFPPGVPITVEHSYTPMQGGTVASALDREYRGQALAPDSDYTTRFCVDDAFLRGYDRKRYKADGAKNYNVFPVEGWIGYTLSPGANWRGPIGRFRLTVDKGYADRLVSLCMDGLRKISPTRFEVIKTDYEPTHDLDVLFVTFAPTEGGQ